MKLSISLLLISAAVVAGCSRPVVRETVIERPVYVNPPAAPAAGTTIVTPPAAAAGATSNSCSYASQSFSHGALSCQDRTEFKCNNGSWTRTYTAC
jgi:hypothetical protein